MSRPPRPGGPLKREREDKKNCVLKGVLVCTTGLSAEKRVRHVYTKIHDEIRPIPD